jgi:hypothetical protein
MPEPTHELSRTPSSLQTPVYPADLQDAMQDTLSKLADVDLNYKLRRELLGSRSVSDAKGERLRAELETLYHGERQPLVLRLADLHARMMRITLRRGSLTKAATTGLPVHTS